jgi:hypothetical protein
MTAIPPRWALPTIFLLMALTPHPRAAEGGKGGGKGVIAISAG